MRPRSRRASRSSPCPRSKRQHHSINTVNADKADRPHRYVAHPQMTIETKTIARTVGHSDGDPERSGTCLAIENPTPRPTKTPHPMRIPEGRDRSALKPFVSPGPTVFLTAWETEAGSDRGRARRN